MAPDKWIQIAVVLNAFFPNDIQYNNLCWKNVSERFHSTGETTLYYLKSWNTGSKKWHENKKNIKQLLCMHVYTSSSPIRARSIPELIWRVQCTGDKAYYTSSCRQRNFRELIIWPHQNQTKCNTTRTGKKKIMSWYSHPPTWRNNQNCGNF
jgi:hypothetical protein